MTRKKEWDETIGSDTTTFIQWKGTDVCMDWHCSCGQHSHVDGDFVYSVKCFRCGKVWEVGSRVALRETTNENLIERAIEDTTRI